MKKNKSYPLAFTLPVPVTQAHVEKILETRGLFFKALLYVQAVRLDPDKLRVGGARLTDAAVAYVVACEAARVAVRLKDDFRDDDALTREGTEASTPHQYYRTQKNIPLTNWRNNG